MIIHNAKHTKTHNLAYLDFVSDNKNFNHLKFSSLKSQLILRMNQLNFHQQTDKIRC